MNGIMKVPFYGNEIVAVEKDGKKYVAMKPIAEALGLDWSGQLGLIKNDVVLSSTMVVTSIVADDGKMREMVCLPLEYLNGWLFKIPASRYKGNRRKAIELYQCECYHALHNYWHNGGAVNPRLDEAQAAGVVGAVAVAGEGRFSDEICNALKAVCARLEQNAKAMTVMTARIVYLGNFEPKGRPYEISNATGRPKDHFVSGYFTSNSRARKISMLELHPELPWEK